MKEALSMKSKIFPRFNSLLKRGKVASTALGKVLQDRYEWYHSSLSCRSESHLSFISPGDHEFSCSNSPAYPSFYHVFKQRNRADDKHGRRLRHVSAVVGASPMMRLSGFGHSPEVRQLRVTDSPFSTKDMGEDYQVDIHAEEFIKRFYKELERQRLNSTWF